MYPIDFVKFFSIYDVLYFVLIPMQYMLCQRNPSIKIRALSDSMISVLNDLEKSLPYEDITFFRKLAEKELLEKEGLSIKNLLDGVVSWTLGEGWYSLSRNLFDGLKFDPDRVSSGLLDIDTDPNETNIYISVCLGSGSFRLSLSTPNSVDGVGAGEFLPFLSFEFSSLLFIHLQKGESNLIQTNISLADFSVYEAKDSKVHDQKSGLKLGSEFNKLISRRKSLGPVKRRKLAFEFDDPNAPLLTAIIDHHLPTSDYEMSISFTLQELEIILSPDVLSMQIYLTKFFTLPKEREMHSINRLSDLQTQLATVEPMIKQLQNIMLKMKIKAPRLVLTENTEIVPGMNLIIIDLGYAFFSTEKLSKLERQPLIDKYQMEILQIEVFLTTGDETLRQPELDKVVLVDKFDIAIEIQISVLSWDTLLAPIMLFVEIPALSIKISESTIERLLHIYQRISQHSTKSVRKVLSIFSQQTIHDPRSVVQTSPEKAASTIDDFSDYASVKSTAPEKSIVAGGGMVFELPRTASIDDFSDYASVKSTAPEKSIVAGGGMVFDRPRTASIDDFSDYASVKSTAPEKSIVAGGGMVFELPRTASIDDFSDYASVKSTAPEKSIVAGGGMVFELPRTASIDDFSDYASVKSTAPEKSIVAGGGMVFELPRTASIDDFSDYASVKSAENSLKTSKSKVREVFSEAKQQPDELTEKIIYIQSKLEKTEAIFSSLLSELRLTELDPSKNSLHNSMKDESLKVFEDIKELKISLIESQMKLREFDGSADLSDSFTKNYHKFSLDHRLEVVSNLLNRADANKAISTESLDGGYFYPRQCDIEPLVPRKACNHASKKDNTRLNHKRLLSAEARVSVINIDVYCDISYNQKIFGKDFTSHSSHGVTFKCKITEMSLKACHSSDISTISLLVHDISVLRMIPGENGPEYLMSSEATMVGRNVSYDRFQESGCSDIFCADVEVKHADPLICNQISAQIKVGFLGLSIDRRTVDVLNYFTQNIKSQILQTKHESLSRHNSSAKTLNIGEILFQYVPTSFGNLECIFRGVEFRVPTDFSENASILSMTIGKIQLQSQLEKNTDINSVIFVHSFIISDISLLIDKKPVIDPITVSIIAAIGTSSSQSLSFSFDWSKFSAGKSAFPPKTFHLTSDCNIFLSCGVSPILFRINEDLSRCLGRWLQLVIIKELASNSCHRNADEPTVSIVERTVSIVDRINSVVDKIEVDILFYELLFSVEVGTDGISEAGKKEPQPPISSVKSHPLFEFTIREINLQAIHIPLIGESDELNLSIALINLQGLKSRCLVIKRVLYTAPDISSEVSKCFEASLRYSKSRNMRHSKSRDLNIKLELNKLQLVVTSEAIIGLSNVLVMNLKAYYDASNLARGSQESLVIKDKKKLVSPLYIDLSNCFILFLKDLYFAAL
jgi:hypothetical protein